MSPGPVLRLYSSNYMLSCLVSNVLWTIEASTNLLKQQVYVARASAPHDVVSRGPLALTMRIKMMSGLQDAGNMPTCPHGSERDMEIVFRQNSAVR